MEARKKKNPIWVQALVFFGSLGMFFGVCFYLLMTPGLFGFRHGGHGYPPKVRMELNNLETAVGQYRADYGVVPSSKLTARSGLNSVSFGVPDELNLKRTRPSNAEIMLIMMALEHFPNGVPVEFNRENIRNPRRVAYLDLRISESTNDSGFGPDGCYRDPWGNPYVISLDLDGEGYCADAMYSRPQVAIDPETNQPIRTKVATKVESTSVIWERSVLVWSRGPDGKADPNVLANQGVNADNILSW